MNRGREVVSLAAPVCGIRPLTLFLTVMLLALVGFRGDEPREGVVRTGGL
jgi:hypothetical protein